MGDAGPCVVVHWWFGDGWVSVGERCLHCLRDDDEEVCLNDASVSDSKSSLSIQFLKLRLKQVNISHIIFTG